MHIWVQLGAASVKFQADSLEGEKEARLKGVEKRDRN